MRLTPIVFVFCLFFLLYQITETSLTPRYIAVDHITLNCGTSGNSKGLDGRDWSGDINSKFFLPKEHNLKPKSSKPPKEGFVQRAPYTTARISYSQFTYVYPVTLGPKFVRLFFHPASYSGFEGSKDFFTVKAGSFILLRNFSASINLADSLHEHTLVKEFCINVEENQKLNLTFIPFSTTSSNFYAFINGIEIISMPEHLYYSPKGQIQSEKVPVYVGQSPQFYINYSMALNMVFRLNVGGGLISPMEDTGFFREWSPDSDYFLGGGVIPHNPSLIPKYSEIRNYTAPDDLYWSARSMGPNPAKNLQSNLTWGIPVDSGFNYLVRLHFCEIDSNINVVGERRFIIYIDYQLAEENADVILWTYNSGKPFYKDYVVMIRKKGVEDNDNHILSIDLHPRSDGTFNDAILNGVEVFKLSKPDGNLAGPSSEMVPSLPAASTAKESKTKKTTLISIGSGVSFLVVLTSMCCVLLLELRKAKRYGSNYCPLSKYKGKSTRTKGSEMPEDILSLHAAAIEVYCGPLLELDSGIGLTTTNSRLINPDSDIVTGTSRDIFTGNSNTKT
ncbi:receptor-like protein kinase FERONIA [Fagus crenata]